MKKKLIALAGILAVCLSLGQKASAQNCRGLDVNVGWGGYPLKEWSEFANPLHSFFSKLFSGIREELPAKELSAIYSDVRGNLYCTGAIAVQCDKHINDWLSIPVTVSDNVIWRHHTNTITQTRRYETYHSTHFLVGLKIRYFDSGTFNCYSSVAGGFAYCNGLSSAVQVVPIGMRFGGRVYGFGELGVGTQYCGAMIGIGLRL